MRIAWTLLQILFASSTIAEEKYVRISLDADWKQTPFALEASEFIASKSNDKFWRFVESFEPFEPKAASDKDVYDVVLETATKLLTTTELNMLKLSLSIRAHSPRVQLYQQLALNSNLKCSVLYQSADGKVACDVNEILISEDIENSVLHDFDHIYPGSTSNNQLLILYANFMDRSFKEVHQQILELVAKKNIRYVLRHYFQTGASHSKLALSGYGVELAVKSTEYKAVDDQEVKDDKKKEKMKDAGGEDEVEGFLFERLRELHPDLRENLDQFRAHLLESNMDMAPLPQWKLQDLSFQAGQRIMSASSQDRLKLLKDLSQNTPMVARSLAKTTVKEELRNEITENQQEFEKISIAPGDASLFVNGIETTMEDLDTFKLVSLLHAESDGLAKLSKLDLDMSRTGSLLALNVFPKDESLILDIRADAVQWMNDLEKDSQYHYWPSHLQEILRPTFPGMLRYIAKNIFHVVAFVDPSTTEGISVLNNFKRFIEQSTPARFGVVFVSESSVTTKPEDSASAGILRAFSFVKSDKSTKDAFLFLSTIYRSSNDAPPEPFDVIHMFRSWYGKEEATEVLGAHSDYDDVRKISKRFLEKVGLKGLPQILVNGEQLSPEEMKDIENSIVEKIHVQTPAIQQAVYLGQVSPYPNVLDYLMSQTNVVARINSLIQTTKGDYITFSNIDQDLPSNDADFKKLNKEDALTVLAKRVKYFVHDSGSTTMWLVADASSPTGLTIIKNALKYVQKQKSTRLSIIIHGKEDDDISLNNVFITICNLRKNLISGVAKLLLKMLEKSKSFAKIVKSESELTKMAEGITGINKKKLFEMLSSKEELQKTRDMIRQNNILIKNGFNVKEGDSLVVANGRVIGPLKPEELFVVEDFRLLQDYENNRGGYKILEIVENMKLPNLPPDGHDRYKSDLVMQIAAGLSTRNDEKRSTLSFKDDQHSVIHLPPRTDDLSFDVDAVLDPLTAGTQKLAPILLVLYEALNINLKVFLNCKGQHSELPVKRFYQYVLQPHLTFDAEGNLLNDQAAIFKNLPHSALLTLNMDTPQSWLIKAIGSNQDLDNINLEMASGYVYGDFRLENILVEGHCSEGETRQPPRGLQFILGTEKEPDQFDTIVMANFGYFQLKAFPGSFVLQLRDGRSSQIYKIDSLTGGKKYSSAENYSVVVDSFTGKFLNVKVKRREGQERADLLSESGEEEDDEFGIWQSIANYVKSDTKSSKNTDGKIHIFTVATGLLYERFLRIMMLSVLKHTTTPVKFWFLKNYLSSGFTDFLPHYAKEYNFEYELVQYQWPRWLNRQTEKQRIIWGYKILFLDVLFPLNLERIIFVDADQIVRADLKELMDMDLGGAPYAYTPFCNDRPEVEGFRFWNHGYWKSHLAGRPYHISALYVVDLKRFRRIAAGDRLRGQYQGLSQDPNSLSNLDQDLPNNMIHQVEIKSLPQEWLWCETWCSDSSKKHAKTIDMCNNPQTKEPKLQRAMRIAPEWSEYDDIIRSLQQVAANSNTSKDEEPAIKVEL